VGERESSAEKDKRVLDAVAFISKKFVSEVC
jgi:hypothetical protein